MSDVEDAADTRRRALDALVAVAARLAAADRLAPPADEPALGAIADAAVVAVGVTAASIALHDAASGRLVFRAAAGPQGGGVVGLSVAANEGIAGYAFSTGQALAIADVAADPRFERATAERDRLSAALTPGRATGRRCGSDRRHGAARPARRPAVRPRRHGARGAVRGRGDDRGPDTVASITTPCELLRSALIGVAADGAGADGLGPQAIETLLAAASETPGRRRPAVAPGRPDRPPARGRSGRRRARDRLARRAPRPAGAPRIHGSLTTPWPVAA